MNDDTTWIVAFRSKDTHQIVGPIWYHECKRKPTNWAIARCYTSCQFAIMSGQGYDYDHGVPDSVLQALEWKEVAL